MDNLSIQKAVPRLDPQRNATAEGCCRRADRPKFPKLGGGAWITGLFGLQTQTSESCCSTPAFMGASVGDASGVWWQVVLGHVRVHG